MAAPGPEPSPSIEVTEPAGPDEPVEPSEPSEPSEPTSGEDAAEPATTEPPRDELSPPAPSMPRVHLHGSDPLELLELGVPESGSDGTLDGLHFRRLCSAPCREAIEIPVGTRVFVGGRRTMPSRAFVLPADPEIHIHARRGSTVMRSAGFVSTVFGILAIPSGAVLAARVQSSGGRAAGFSLVGLGTTGLIAGIALIVRSRTRVRVQGQSPQAFSEDRQQRGPLEGAPVVH